MAVAGEWREQGRCWDSGVDMIPYQRGAEARAAYLIEEFCMSCPVRTRCCEEGLVPGNYGIWGGFYLPPPWINNARTRAKVRMRRHLMMLGSTEDAVA